MLLMSIIYHGMLMLAYVCMTKAVANRLILVGAGLPVLHYGAIWLDAYTGWLGGGPGDANIGLALLGMFVVWPISASLIFIGNSRRAKSKDSENDQKT